MTNTLVVYYMSSAFRADMSESVWPWDEKPWMSESKCNLICCQTVQLREWSDAIGLIKARRVSPSVKIKDRDDASDLDWHERKKVWINIPHTTLDSLAEFMAAFQTNYSPSRRWEDLYMCVWQIKDSLSAPLSYSSMALSDLIYSSTSLVASSSNL